MSYVTLVIGTITLLPYKIYEPFICPSGMIILYYSVLDIFPLVIHVYTICIAYQPQRDYYLFSLGSHVYLIALGQPFWLL